MIKQNLEEIEGKICAACKKANRKREEVVLIAVSKTKPVGMIREVLEWKVNDFGENKVQELCDKHSQLEQSINWHFIGHLQRNKVKYIIDKVCLIHSVDSLRLAQQIDLESRKQNLISSILIEINIANEDSKFGIKSDEAIPLINEISKLKNIKIKGLMTIPPFVEQQEENREYFRSLRKLSIDIKREKIDNVDMSILSMGMTNDYEVAIEEGATIVRVGTGIFGDRNYNNG